MKITAEEARKICGPSVIEHLQPVYDMIREAAAGKIRKIHLHSSFWTYGGYDKTPDWVNATRILEEDGFIVSFYYKELQFVDMYTIVEW